MLDLHISKTHVNNNSLTQTFKKNIVKCKKMISEENKQKYFLENQIARIFCNPTKKDFFLYAVGLRHKYFLKKFFYVRIYGKIPGK